MSLFTSLRVVGKVKICSLRRHNQKYRQLRDVIQGALVSEATDPNSMLRQGLEITYCVSTITATRTSTPGEVDFSFGYQRQDNGKKFVTDCKNGELGQFMRRKVQDKVQNVSEIWELILSVNSADADRFLEEHSRLHHSESSSASEAVLGAVLPSLRIGYSPAVADAHIQTAGSVPAEESRAGDRLAAETVTASVPFAVVNKVISEVLRSKDHMDYDLHCLLAKHGSEIVPLLMLDENGYNMLHQCIQHNRLSFLMVLQAHGYWADLIEQEVPRGSTSEYAECTPKQMADRMRMRRLVRELDRLSQQEQSMSGRNAALRASRSGNLPLLKSMAASGNADMKAKDSEGNSCVHWAAVSGNLDAVIYLTQKLQLQSDLRNENGQTPLHIAVMYGQSTLIEYLIKECQLDAKEADGSCKTPLQRTAENGDIATQSELLKCNVEIDQSLGVIAAQFGRHKYLEHTLKSHNLDHMRKDSDGKSCLMLAAENGHLKIVEYLLNHYDIPLTDVSKQNRNVFHYVGNKGHANVAKVLVAKARTAGLLPDILNQRDTHSIEQLCSLVRGVDKGRAAWHYVHLKRKYVPLFQKCIKSGRVDASRVGTIIQSGWGQEPEADVLKKSVQHYLGNNPTNNGRDDLSPCLLAIAKGHSEVAKLFIEAGSDVKLKDCVGLTGMHFAAMRGSLDVAVMLELHGLELNTEDEDGDKPLDVAEANEHTQLVNFFKGQEHRREVQVRVRLFGITEFALYLDVQ